MTFSSHSTNLVVRFLGFTHLLIAVGAGVSSLVSLKVLVFTDDCGENPLLVAGFISACTGLGYSIQRWIKVKVFPESVDPVRLEFLKRWGLMLIFTWGIAFFLAFLSVGKIPWLYMAVLVLAGMGYAILPGRSSIRQLPHMKLPFLSLVWGVATVILPILMLGGSDYNIFRDQNLDLIILVFFARTLYVAGLTIPFDVRDLNIDHKEMKTTPQYMGVRGALICATVLVLMSGGVWTIEGQWELLVHSLLTASVVYPWACSEKRSEYYYSILLDSMLVLQAVVLT